MFPWGVVSPIEDVAFRFEVACRCSCEHKAILAESAIPRDVSYGAVVKGKRDAKITEVPKFWVNVVRRPVITLALDLVVVRCNQRSTATVG